MSTATLPFIGLALLGLSGCARGPAGGPSVPTARNRLIVSMTLQQPINNQYYYAFAFDDDSGDATDPVPRADGPIAIISSTNFFNGVVGGSFTVLVLYRGGQFLVYRRTDLGNGTEQLEPASRAFVVPPVTPVTGSTLGFTLDLDAKTDSNNYLFRHDATGVLSVPELNVNFVSTDRIQLDPSNNLIKAFDAFFPGIASSYFTFPINGTQTFTNNGTVGEPTGDVDPGNDPTANVNTPQLDITDFSLRVERS